jgi:hypothetical protein
VGLRCVVVYIVTADLALFDSVLLGMEEADLFATAKQRHVGIRCPIFPLGSDEGIPWTFLDGETSTMPCLTLSLDPFPFRNYSSATGSSSPVNTFLFVWIRSCLLSRAALVLARLASISSLSALSRAASALALWI